MSASAKPTAKRASVLDALVAMDGEIRERVRAHFRELGDPSDAELARAFLVNPLAWIQDEITFLTEIAKEYALRAEAIGSAANAPRSAAANPPEGA
jgi:hypothetical protein